MRVESHPHVIAITVAVYAALIAILIILGSGCAHYPRVPAEDRPLDRQQASAVMIEMFCVADDPFGSGEVIHMRSGHGSAVLLDARHMLTALHVVACPYLPDVHATLASGKRLRVVVSREWRDRDLALLEIASAEALAGIKPPRLALAVEGATACTSVAWPERGGNCGAIEAVYPVTCQTAGGGTWCHSMRAPLRVTPGNSGGGVYVDGALVGVVTGYQTRDGVDYGSFTSAQGVMP